MATLPGTSVPGFHIPPLRGWEHGHDLGPGLPNESPKEMARKSVTDVTAVCRVIQIGNRAGICARCGLSDNSCGLALLARADFAQEAPGINSQVVAVVPGELDGVLTNAFGRERLGRRLEHGERSGREFRGITCAASGFGSLFFAHGAGARIAQVDEGVVRDVAVVPLDVNACARGEVHLY